MTPTLGTIASGPLSIDVPRLLETRLLVQANSGGGKSWALRRLLEQSARDVQQLVIDPEGEFATLREKFDYVICAPSGADAVATPQTAALLARRLLESGVSAILDIYDLKAHDRQLFVRRFIDALINAPKALWHPVMVVLDEAHIFAPQVGSAEASSAVIDLATRGRKRGQCLVCATQRLSKLHKDVAAELLNKLVGRTGLDVDVKRAADELGMTAKDATTQLRSLSPGTFFAFGPALCPSVQSLKTGEVVTTHPKSGQRLMKAPPAPSPKIMDTLAKLADLPTAAANEIQTLEAAHEIIKRHERTIRDQQRQLETRPAVEPERIEVPAISPCDIEGLYETVGTLTEQLQRTERLLTNVRLGLEQVRSGAVAGVTPAKPPSPMEWGKRFESLAVKGPVSTAPAQTAIAKRTQSQAGEQTGEGVKLDKACRQILIALYWLREENVTPSKVGFYADYSHGSGSFNNAMSKLRTAGLVAGWQITAAGCDQAVRLSCGPKPTGGELREWLSKKLSKAENAILDALIAMHPCRVTAQQLGQLSGYAAGSGSFNNALSRLRSIEAAEGYERDGGVKASDVFFE